MKREFIIPICLLMGSASMAQQELFSYTAFVQQMEMQAEREEAPIENDSFLLQMEYFKKHPLNLNEAEEDDIKKLLLLSDLQVKNFISYRHIFGKLLTIYELQAVPSWDVAIIQVLLPFVTINDEKDVVRNMKDRWTGGEHSLLINAGHVLEKAKGFSKPPDSTSHYGGSPTRLYMRYKYNYKNKLQWGLLGDKDAGEQFFRGKQKTGFDFYSFHFFASKIGLLKSVAVGDFTVNMGQGLIQWQSLAFKKSADITNVKRQSPVLNPYTSAGESNFQRGIGLTLQKSSWEGTAFISLQKVSANLEVDSVTDEGHITSLLSSGYHRTLSELADKNNVKQFATGMSLKYSENRWHLSLNGIHYRFSRPIQKQDQPYNLFALRGKFFTNFSVDYSYTYKNVHLFGEVAIDKNGNKAFLNGLLVSLAPTMDASLVHRSISSRYQAVYANAFTENTDPSNEKGLFAGLTVRPSGFIRLDAFADIFSFPWLKYRLDAPSRGREYFIQLSIIPNKQIQISSRYRSESKQANRPGDNTTTSVVDNIRRRNWRIHADVNINRAFTMRNRFEVSWYDIKETGSEQGFLAFIDFLCKPPLKPWSGNIRLLRFETEGYNSRLYAYENDVLYNFSIPAFSGKGYRYYLNLSYDITSICKSLKLKVKTFQCWFRFAQSMYPGKTTIGDGLESIEGNKKSEVKLELIISL